MHQQSNYQYRGVFIEDKWGPDLMELKDWREMIDYFTALKFNCLCIGLYGCWCVQYNNQVTEFMMVPSKKYRALRTPGRISYYSPNAGRMQSLNYVPTLARKDLLGQIMAYGKRRGLTVFPLFNSLGHNTLLPRKYPKVASRDARGRPKGYGFCLSAPATFRMLTDIYGEIIARYLRPNGIKIFHIGMDEVGPYAGTDPRDPCKVVDPWCECPDCRSRPKADLFREHIVALAKYLKAQGMEKIIVYADQLESCHLINAALLKRLDREGLRDSLVFNFWDYYVKPKINLHPELEIKRWIMPLTCYYNWSSYGCPINTLENIINLLAQGKAAGAEGGLSYSVFDWGWAHHFHAFSRTLLSRRKLGKAQLLAEFCRETFGRRAKQAAEALGYLTAHPDPVWFKLMYYGYTYPAKALPYPRAYPAEVLENYLRPNLEKRVSQMRAELAEMTKARAILAALRQTVKAGVPGKIAANLYAECVRIANTLEIFLALLEAHPQPPERAALKRCLALQLEIMTVMEKTKPAYLVPCILRDLTPMHRFLSGQVKAACRIGSRNGGQP